MCSPRSLSSFLKCFRDWTHALVSCLVGMNDAKQYFEANAPKKPVEVVEQAEEQAEEQAQEQADE